MICSSARVCRIISAVTLARVHGQVCEGVARACWREDVVHRAWFTLGEWLHRELLLYCFETSCWNGKRLTRCSRPRCSSNGGGSTTTRSDRTVPWDTGPRGVAAPCVRFGYASANARGWSIGGQNPNLRTGVIHGGRSLEIVVKVIAMVLSH